jgi:phage shock protein A
MKKQEQQQTEKELKAELKALKVKITTAKKKRNEAAARWRAKKAAEELNPVAAKAVKAPKTVARSPETVQAAKDIIDAVKAGADTKEDTYCVMSVRLFDQNFKLKVIRQNGKFYLVNQSTNVFGVNTGIVSEHADRGLAVRALATKLNDLAGQ